MVMEEAKIETLIHPSIDKEAFQNAFFKDDVYTFIK